MKHKSKLSEMLIAFCVCTTCITLLEGCMGMLFYPTEQLNYSAFFSPPLFGALGVLLGMVTWSKRELSIKRTLFRKVLHLLLIECMVFGLNYISGNRFSGLINLALFVGIAVVFTAVYGILWVNDRRSADLFNRRLKDYQAKQLQEREE